MTRLLVRRLVFTSTAVFALVTLGLAFVRVARPVAGMEQGPMVERSLPTQQSAPAPLQAPNVASPSANLTRQISKADVAKHSRVEDCWIIIKRGVYDVTTYIAFHPAPPETITDTCGTDATQPFETKGTHHRPHSRRAVELLERLRIGTLAP